MTPNDRRQIACAAAEALLQSRKRIQRLEFVAGFDAVVDSIIDVVDSRKSDSYTRIDTMQSFADRIASAAGRSANIELVVTRKKIGGNACNLAQAAARLGAQITLLANVSDSQNPDQFDPSLRALTDRCKRVITLGPPAATDALEFSDGKIMLGKTAPLDAISLESLLDAIGGARAFAELLALTDVLVTANWTMTRAMSDIWRTLARDILTTMPECDRPRRFFVDLADPAKRTDDDLSLALRHLREINALSPVAIGLNLAEAGRIAAVIGVTVKELPASPDHGDLRTMAAALHGPLGLDVVVLHTQRCAASASSTGASGFTGPFSHSPALSTGAGDHFNAGWLLADALDLPDSQRLAVASAVASWYTRHAASPSLPEVCEFLGSLPEPEPL